MNSTAQSLISLEQFVPKPEPKTIVVFRKFNEDGPVIAIFVEENYCHYDSRFKNSYMRIGQHGLCDISNIHKATDLATALEFTDLARELRSIGYILDIQQDYQYAN